MANKDWACGMHPVRMMDGQAPFTTRWPLKQAVSSVKQVTSIYKGQIVLWNKTVGFVRANAITNPGSGDIMGVAAEHYFGSVINSTKTDLAVWEGDKHIFAIQSDNATTTSTANSMLGKCYSVVNQTVGSTVTGLSGMELDFSSGVTNSSKPLRVVGATGEIGEGTGANLKVLVRFNFGAVYTQDATGVY